MKNARARTTTRSRRADSGGQKLDWLIAPDEFRDSIFSVHHLCWTSSSHMVSIWSIPLNHILIFCSTNTWTWFYVIYSLLAAPLSLNPLVATTRRFSVERLHRHLLHLNILYKIHVSFGTFDLLNELDRCHVTHPSRWPKLLPLVSLLSWFFPYVYSTSCVQKHIAYCRGISQ